MEAWFKLLHTSSKKPDSQQRTARAALLAATEAAAVAAGSPGDQSTRYTQHSLTGVLTGVATQPWGFCGFLFFPLFAGMGQGEHYRVILQG